MGEFELRSTLSLADEPDLPVSRLYRIKPPGWNTIDMIALTDYIILEANEHCVPVYALVEKVIVPEIASILERSGTTFNWVMNSADGKNVVGLISSSKWAYALGQLTLQDDLHRLTLFSIQEIIPKDGLLSPTKRWCDECYEDARLHGKPVYDRLIWKLRPVTVCNYHQRALRNCCPFPDCQKTISHLPRHMYAGFCPHCHRWLGRSSVVAAGNDIAPDKLLWMAQKSTNDNIFALLQAIALNPSSFGKQNIFKSIQRLLREVFAGNLSAFARAIGVVQITIRNYRDQKQLPSLSTTLAICDLLNLSLTELYSGNFDTSTITFTPAQMSIPINSKYKCPEHELARELEAEIENKTTSPVHLGKVAARLGYSRWYLLSHFPSQSNQIQKRWKAFALAQLKAALSAPVPVSLASIADKLQYEGAHLKELFPKTSQAIIQRHQDWLTQRHETIKNALKSALLEYPPQNATTIAEKLGMSVHELWRLYPELYHDVTTRYLEFRNALTKASEAQDYTQIIQTVFTLHTNGHHFPSARSVFQSMSSHFDSRNRAHRQAYKDAIHELRQLAEAGNKSLPE